MGYPQITIAVLLGLEALATASIGGINGIGRVSRVALIVGVLYWGGFWS